MKLIRFLILSIAITLLSAASAAAADMDAFHVKDTIPGSGYVVKDLYEQTSQGFSYDMPENGVTVLIFYAGNCGKSSQGLRTFANSKWIDHEDVYIRAVESRGCPLSTIKNQMKENAGSNASQLHPVLGNNALLFEYVHKVYPNQRSITYPFVVLLTNEGGTPYIRYASEDVQTEAFYSDAIETLLQEDRDRYVTQNGLVYRIDDTSATIVDRTDTLPAYLSIPVHIGGVPVRAIAEGVFRGCEELENVVIFPTTSTIGAYAFADCPNLYRVDLGGQQILEGAFSNCPNLQVLQMDDVSYIGKNAFKNCSNLMAILSWPHQIQSLFIIGESAFSGCSNLDLVIPSSVLYIADNAFENSGITSATLPANLSKLGSGVFQGCTSLKNASIPSQITAIPDKTFAGCTSLQTVSYSNQLTAIGTEAFLNCSSLKQVTLPEGLTALGRNAFSGTGLTSVHIPDSVTALEWGVFLDCKSLISATLPKNLTELPESLFAGCSSLTTVTLPDSLTAIPDNLFSECKALTSIQIPESVTVIGDSAFYYCEKLELIALPDGLTTLGGGAFYFCDGLTSIQIPAGVDFIGDWCFYSCDMLSGIYFQGDAPSEFGWYAVDPYQYGITLYYLEGKSGWTDSAAYDSAEGTWNGYQLAPWDSVVSGTCGTRGNEANVIWSLDMNTGVFTLSGTGAAKDIPYNSGYKDRHFVSDWTSYRSFIRTVIVEEGITYVGNGAFYDMPVLTAAYFPASITSLGFRIFDGCENFSTAYFYGDAPASVGANLFLDCASDFTICYPDGAAGWTSPNWNQWPATHTILRDGILTHNSAHAKAGTQAILAIYNEDHQFLGSSIAHWGETPLLEIPLPQDTKTANLRLFYLDDGTPLRAVNDLTSLLPQAT